MNARAALPEPEPIAPTDVDVRAAQEIAKDLRLSMFGDSFDRLCLHLAIHRLKGQLEVHHEIKAEEEAAIGLTIG